MSREGPPLPGEDVVPATAGRRPRLLVLPREHGAWAMMLAPYIIGAAAAGYSWLLLPGLAAVLLLFFSRPPLALLLKRRSRPRGRGASARLWLNFALPAASGLGIFGILTVAGGLWCLPVFGCAGLILFFMHTLVAQRSRERSAAAELLGIAMLTLTAPLADYLGRGSLTGEAAALWLLCLAYFGASVFYVKMKVAASIKRGTRLEAGGRMPLAAGSLVYTIAMLVLAGVLAASGWAPPLVLLAYAPVAFYGAWSFIFLGPRLSIKREGAVQTLLALSFTGLMILSYRV